MKGDTKGEREGGRETEENGDRKRKREIVVPILCPPESNRCRVQAINYLFM
jgi:hypothetical protein